MKVGDVPQDKEFLDEETGREICYAVDENGNYTSVLSFGWKPKNDAIRQALDSVYEQAEETRMRVIAGELSPVAYYMEIAQMDLKLLSEYVGLSRRKVKKHMKQTNFEPLKDDILIKYAEVFNIKIEDLINSDLIKKGLRKNED